MGKTIIEKILAKAVGKSEVTPGEYVQFKAARIDHPFVIAGTDMAPRLVGQSKPFDAKKVVFAPDHCGSYTRVGSPTTNRESHRVNSEWARQMGVPEEHILELGRIGNCHHLAVEKAWHCPEASTFGHVGRPRHNRWRRGLFWELLSASATAFLRSGWTWFRVPESIKFNITGKLQDGVMGRDVYEYILGQIGPAGAIYQVMEFTGPVMDEMSMDGRLSMCCLAMFTGAKLGIVNPDQKIIDWFKARTRCALRAPGSDPDAKYVKTYDTMVRRLSPRWLFPRTDIL